MISYSLIFACLLWFHFQILATMNNLLLHNQNDVHHHDAHHPDAGHKPRAHAIPGLEIIANDVRCSHGATVSHIDPEQLFYLQARGLPRSEAERLIVQGFVQPIVDRVPLASMRERLAEEIIQRFWE